MTPGKNYEETMLDVYAFAQREKIPYRSMLLDSWWYGEYQHNGSGMLSWDESSSKDVDPLDPNGQSKSIYLLVFTENLLENTDGVLRTPPISVLSGRQPATLTF